MKKIKYIYSFWLLMSFFSLLTACEDEIGLSPGQDIDATGAFKDEASAQATLMGVYSSCQPLEMYGGMPQIISDFMSDNSSFIGSFPTFQEIREYNTISTNGNVLGIWQQHYRVISRANNVIGNVTAVNDPGFTDAEKAQFIAEAKFLRALAHFQLVNLFAHPYQLSNGNSLGIPVVIEEFTGEISFPGRNTVNEVHAQIEQDLLEAIPDLPEENASGGRASIGAAQALLSRLYLYRGEWDDAATHAKSVLDNAAVHAPLADYSFYTTKGTSEDVFAIQNSSTDNGRTGSGGWASWHRPAAEGGRGDVKFSPELTAAYEEEPGDLRYDLSSTGTGADNLPALFSTKWSEAVSNEDNSPVIRTTEVVLNYVEAKAEADNAVSQELIDWMNVLRNRAGLADWTLGTFASKDAFVTAVLNERRKELAFEGHRRMDLLRRGQALRAGNPAAAFGADKTILPIPQREIDNNPGLAGQQNQSY